MLLGEDGRHKDEGIILMQTLAVQSSMLDESDLQVAYMLFGTLLHDLSGGSKKVTYLPCGILGPRMLRNQGIL